MDRKEEVQGEINNLMEIHIPSQVARCAEATKALSDRKAAFAAEQIAAGASGKKLTDADMAYQHFLIQEAAETVMHAGLALSEMGKSVMDLENELALLSD